jgi:ribosomal protein L33
MKKLKGAFIITMLIAVTVISCKKDDGNTDDNVAGAATVTAGNYGFDGTGGASFKSTKAGIVQVGTLWTLSAIKDGSNESISIVLGNVTATGTYKLDQGNNDGNGAIMLKDYTSATGLGSYSTDLAATGGMTGGGEVKITKLTATEAEGEFYIVAHNSAGKDAFVEQGKFSGKLNKR